VFSRALTSTSVTTGMDRCYEVGTQFQREVDGDQGRPLQGGGVQVKARKDTGDGPRRGKGDLRLP
jgi:hypothetical protein